MKFVIDNYTNNQTSLKQKYNPNIVENYLPKISKGKTKTRCEISPKLTIKTQD